MKYLIRPLNKNILALLKEYHQRSVAAFEPLGVNELTNIITALYSKGLISTRKLIVGDKEEAEIYITDAGMKLLAEYEKEKNSWMSELCMN